MHFLRSLRYRLAIIYGAAAVFVLSVFFVAIKVGFERRFSNYMQKSRERSGRHLLSAIQMLKYDYKDWKKVERFSYFFLRRKIYGLKIVDAEGQVVLSINRARRQRIREQYRHMHRRRDGYMRRPPFYRQHGMMSPRLDNKKGSSLYGKRRSFWERRYLPRPPRKRGRYLVTKSYKFELSGRQFGTAYISYFAGSYLFDLVDKLFISQLGQLFLLIGIGASLFFVVIAWMIGRKISHPIEQVASAAARVSHGELDVGIPVEGTGEVAELATAFNAMSSALMSRDALQRKMSSDIAHELRTPVAILKGHLEGMAEGVIAAGPQELHSLLEETARLETIVDDLKAIWSLEDGNKSIGLQRVDLPAFLDELVKRYMPVAEKKGLHLSYEVPQVSLFCLAGQEQLLRVLSNILNNALRYAKTGVVVSFDFSDALVVTIADDGPGIPEKDLPHIFERFFRTDRSRSRETGGAGLGLSIAKEAVQKMGGQIEASNRAEGGSQFVVRLPLAD